MGKLTIYKWPFSIAMLNYQRVQPHFFRFSVSLEDSARCIWKWGVPNSTASFVKRGTWWLIWWIIKFRSFSGFPPNFQRYSEWVCSSFITISNLKTPAAGDLATPRVSHWQELVPAARKFSCHVFVPLALTPGDSSAGMWWGRTTAWE